MKIRISDMLDNASELIEKKSEIGYAVNNDRIKEIVFSKISHMKRKHQKRKCAAILIAILGVGSISVGAKELLRSAGVIGGNKAEIMQLQVGRKIEEDAKYSLECSFDFQTDLINPENLYEGNIPIAKYIVEIPINIGDRLPECYLNNGAMIIFTKSTGEGWEVAADTILQFEFMQERVGKTDTVQSGVLEVGYIFNGKLEVQEIVNQNHCSIDFCLENEGIYYLYIKNCSSDRIIINEGTINEEQEE